MENASTYGLKPCKGIPHARIWAQQQAKDLPDGADTWKRWWHVSEDGTHPRHLYFLGKDNIPFHTIIWPALILGLNHAKKGLKSSDPIALLGPGEMALESNVPAMQYLMLAGGQFSKSRKHAVWLPSFLERYHPDTLRYYLSIVMPEFSDSDFNWPDFVAKINTELNANYGNFIHRVLTLGARLPHESGTSPFMDHDGHACVQPQSARRSGLCRHHAIATTAPFQRSTAANHGCVAIWESNPTGCCPMETPEWSPRWA